MDEPTVESIQREFPDRRIRRGADNLWYAGRSPVRGESLADLRDQLHRAEALGADRAYQASR
jgi:hypothetical protein